MVRRVGLWAPLLIVVATAALIPASASAGCEKANLNNPGHHYGLYKNGCIPTTPPVVTPTVPHTTPSGHTSHPLVVHPATQHGKPVTSENLAPEIELPLGTIIQPVGEPEPDMWLWVVTALLPTLLVLWLLIAARTATYAVQRQRPVATAPAA